MSDFEISAINEKRLLIKYVTFKKRHEGGHKLAEQGLRMPSPYENQITKVRVEDDGSCYIVLILNCSKPIYWRSYIKLRLLKNNCTPNTSNAKSDYEYMDQETDHVRHVFDLSTSLSDHVFSDGSIQWLIEFTNDIKLNKKFDFLVRDQPSSYEIIAWKSPISNGRGAHCYENGVGLDVTLVVDGNEIRASKFLLVFASPVFEAMLEDGKWKESFENRIEIIDFDNDTVETLVKIIHGYEIRLASYEKAVQLFLISQKYQIDSLADQLKFFLDNGINKESALEALTVGHRLGLDVVKKLAIEFIVSDNYGKVDELVGFKNITLDIALIFVECLRDKIIS